MIKGGKFKNQRIICVFEGHTVAHGGIKNAIRGIVNMVLHPPPEWSYRLANVESSILAKDNICHSPSLTRNMMPYGVSVAIREEE